MKPKVRSCWGFEALLLVLSHGNYDSRPVVM